MKSSDNHIDRSWADDRIEAYTDGLLSRRERKTFEAIMQKDPALAREVGMAQSVQQALGDLPEPTCPPAAYESVLELARRQSASRPSGTRAHLPWRLRLPALTPVRVIATVTVVLAIATGVWLVDREAAQPRPNAAQVEAALQEVKVALSYVSLAGREAGHAIRARAVDETLIDPVRRAIDQAEIGSFEKVGGDGDAAGIGQTKRGES